MKNYRIMKYLLSILINSKDITNDCTWALQLLTELYDDGRISYEVKRYIRYKIIMYYNSNC